MKSRNWFWGLFFLLAAVFILACQTGAFLSIGIFTILATILLIAIGIQSGVNRNFFGVFLALALLYLIYQKPFRLPFISFWILLLATILVSIGFSILFHGNWGWDDCHHHSGRNISCGDAGYHSQSSENIDGNNPCAKITFGSTSRYLHSDCLKSAVFHVSFGEMDIYFDQVQLSPQGAVVEASSNFGSLKLFVPKQWRVVNHIETNLGSVENDVRFSNPEESAPTLTLEGSASFGSVEIHYV